MIIVNHIEFSGITGFDELKVHKLKNTRKA